MVPVANPSLLPNQAALSDLHVFMSCALCLARCGHCGHHGECAYPWRWAKQGYITKFRNVFGFDSGLPSVVCEHDSYQPSTALQCMASVRTGAQPWPKSVQ